MVVKQNNTKLSYADEKIESIKTLTTAASRPVTTKNITVDIVNDYYPFVDFKFVFPDVTPNNVASRDFFFIVLVNSGATAEYRKRREVIRLTWGNNSNRDQRKASNDERLKNLKWLLVFVVGKAGPRTNDDELNIAEAGQHNDMLTGNIAENYLNNIIKFYMGQVWTSRFNIKYTMKTDDDVYVRIPRVLEYLANARFPRPFYGGWTYAGTLVNREIGGKWTVSWKYYGEKDWPRFNPGAFFILSSDLLYTLFNYAYLRKPFHTDDAYVGVAMRDFGVKITTILSFRISGNMNKEISSFSGCYLLGKIALGHIILILKHLRYFLIVMKRCCVEKIQRSAKFRFCGVGRFSCCRVELRCKLQEKLHCLTGPLFRLKDLSKQKPLFEMSYLLILDSTDYSGTGK